MSPHDAGRPASVRPAALTAVLAIAALWTVARLAPSASAQPGALTHRIHLPRAVRHEGPYEPPPTARATATATHGPTATSEPTATPTRRPAGQPGCAKPSGDAGGFRFSRDGGRTLSAGAQRLANIAYTWAIDVDPRDPDHIVELHAGKLYHSHDAGCTFAQHGPLPKLDAEPTWLTRSPSTPDLIVLSSVFGHDIAVTEDGGATWSTETLPDDVVALAIAPDDAARWTFVGREGLYARTARGAKWERRAVGDDDASLGGTINTASPAPGRWGTWLVGGLDGIIRTTDDGATWDKVDGAMREGGVGSPPQPIVDVVGVSVTYAPSDADVAYAAVNQVARDPSQRGLWRSGDGGVTWERRVVADQPVDADGGGTLPAVMTGGSRVFVSPHAPDDVFFAFGMAFEGYGTDLFRSNDGLRTLRAAHFGGFYEVMTIAWGPKGSDVVFVGASSDIPSAR